MELLVAQRKNHVSGLWNMNLEHFLVFKYKDWNLKPILFNGHFSPFLKQFLPKYFKARCGSSPKNFHTQIWWVCWSLDYDQSPFIVMFVTFRLHISTFWNAQLPEEKEALLVTEEYQEQMSESTFLFLTLDLPTAPLYKDEKEQLIIPQVPLFNILAKFNGNTEKVHIHLHAKSNKWCYNKVQKCTQESCTTDGECIQHQKCKISRCILLSYRSTKPTRRIFSKGFSWPNFLHTSFSALKDSPRTTSSWRRTLQLSTSRSRMCCSRTLRANMGNSVHLMVTLLVFIFSV